MSGHGSILVSKRKTVWIYVFFEQFEKKEIARHLKIRSILMKGLNLLRCIIFVLLLDFCLVSWCPLHPPIYFGALLLYFSFGHKFSLSIKTNCSLVT